MKVALLGSPQAGKKTLFTLLTGRIVPEGRKEGEAIEGHAPVRDTTVDRIAEIVVPQKITYAETTIVLPPDVQAGSVKRLWMEAARRCDLICPVVRGFSSDTVYHPLGSVDLARDRASLETELLLADLELVEKRLQKLVKEKRAGQTQDQLLEEKALLKCEEVISNGTREGLELDDSEQEIVRSLGLFLLKPMLWIHNVDEGDLGDDAVGTLSIAGQIEQEISEIEDEAERREYLSEIGLTASGVDRMNQAVYDQLGLMSFYTMGEDEARAWTLRKGASALEAAGKIHTDIQRGFIRVEIIGFEDLMLAGSEAAVKSQGKMLLKGKEYVVQQGDICMFRFSV